MGFWITLGVSLWNRNTPLIDGHGVGLQTHEWPRLSSRTADVLPAGATVTVEPGIYLPERFGVRIEDLIVIREGGYENLTASPKELLVL